MRSPFLLGLLALACCTSSGFDEVGPSSRGAGDEGPGANAANDIDGGSSDDADGSPPKADGPEGPGTGLSARYPNDVGIASDPNVIFYSGFESDFAGWSYHTPDPTLLAVQSDAGLANGGAKYLRASVSRTRLAASSYVSAAAQFEFPQRVPVAYWRFYARFVGNSATPHHWVRVGAGNASYVSDGLANTVPAGDRGFWFDLDANDAGIFNLYVYWHQMRSSRCNDGSAVPGCAGDQGRTNYYGNIFSPSGQTAFPRDQWFCIEIMTKANTVGQHDGELAVYRNDVLVGEYKPGAPRGRWLRSSFHTWGPYFIDQGPFEGFDFRTSNEVAVKRVTLDAYYERGSLDARIANGLDAPETQTILYDDVVVATKRIGCKSK
ncbi:MAG: hypothetical protein KF819_26700 [Labilithrix sp.]|nr:hypothetical protein [Labilithrix sp.]